MWELLPSRSIPDSPKPKHQEVGLTKVLFAGNEPQQGRVHDARRCIDEARDDEGVPLKGVRLCGGVRGLQEPAHETLVLSMYFVIYFW